jgi:hypothetical protein
MKGEIAGVPYWTIMAKLHRKDHSVSRSICIIGSSIVLLVCN